jgi:hypothetical protein
MIIKFYRSNWKWLFGSLLFAAVIDYSPLSLAQRSGDIIRIGSPNEWSQYEAYWHQLIKNKAQRDSKEPSVNTNPNSSITTENSEEPQQELIKNIRVSDLQLLPILKLNGSSQIMGKIRNGNDKAITVSSVNLEVLDSFGNLVQTSAPSPEPATIPAGETVTFQQQLNTVPADSGFQVRLSRSNPFTIQGGV